MLSMGERGVRANLKNGRIFQKIPIGIFENRPAIYRRYHGWKRKSHRDEWKKDYKWLILTSAFTSTSFSARKDVKNRSLPICRIDYGLTWVELPANHMKALSVGGTQDHVHILLSIPATLPVAKAVQLIKGGSSKWVHDTFVDLRRFAWQEGYSAFSINVSLLEETIRYIERQVEHHQRKTFQEEYLEFLRRHEIDYDERYVWG